jgi:hypothetical protein
MRRICCSTCASKCSTCTKPACCFRKKRKTIKHKKVFKNKQME